MLNVDVDCNLTAAVERPLGLSSDLYPLCCELVPSSLIGNTANHDQR